MVNSPNVKCQGICIVIEFRLACIINFIQIFAVFRGMKILEDEILSKGESVMMPRFWRVQGLVNSPKVI